MKKYSKNIIEQILIQEIVVRLEQALTSLYSFSAPLRLCVKLLISRKDAKTLRDYLLCVGNYRGKEAKRFIYEGKRD